MRTRTLCLIAAMALAAACSDGGGSTPDNNDPGDAGMDVGEDVGADVVEEEVGEDVEADVSFEDVGVVINEVAAAGEPSDWFELYNGTGEAIDLTAWRFTDDVEGRPAGAPFMAGTTIAPGAYLQVTVDDFYPGFKLGGDEALAVMDESGRVVAEVDWAEGQSPPGGSYGRIPDLRGEFKILVANTPGAPNVDNPGGAECGNDVEEEGEGCDDGNLVAGDGCDALCQEELVPECGNDVEEPGEECDDGNLEPGDGCDARCLLELPLGDVVVNEVQAASESGEDWIELVGRAEAPVELEGWYLTDSDPTHVWVFGPGVSIAPGAYLVLERRAAGSFEFGLGAEDAVYLYDASGELVDRTVWLEGEAPLDQSWGRVPDGEGDFMTIEAPTRGEAN